MNLCAVQSSCALTGDSNQNVPAAAIERCATVTLNPFIDRCQRSKLEVYMAECSSKSDEYGRDDGGNTYPSLHAMLVCLQLSQPLALCIDEALIPVSSIRTAGVTV